MEEKNENFGKKGVEISKNGVFRFFDPFFTPEFGGS